MSAAFQCIVDNSMGKGVHTQVTLASGHGSNSDWTTQEKNKIIEAMNARPTPHDPGDGFWKGLAESMPGLTLYDVHAQWNNHLDPTIDPSPFLKEDDETLFKGYKDHRKNIYKHSIIADKVSNGNKDMARLWAAAKTGSG